MRPVTVILEPAHGLRIFHTGFHRMGFNRVESSFSFLFACGKRINEVYPFTGLNQIFLDYCPVNAYEDLVLIV